MNRLAVFLLCLFGLVFSLGFNPSKTPDKNHFAEPTPPRRPEIINMPADVESLTLDKEKVFLPCPWPENSEHYLCPKDGMKVKVTTVAKDEENDVLVYEYNVSDGRIIGQGADVIWDLFGVQPGTYTITAGVDDGCGICGKTLTKTIEVEDCPICDPDCFCPTISVTGPDEVVKAGAPIIFTATVNGGDQDSVTYQWTVAGGTIIEGQGTPKIKVKIDSDLADSTVKATVEVGLEPPCDCPGLTVSDTFVIVSKKP